MSDVRDRAIRAITEDGSFRVITVRTTHLVSEGVKKHGLSGAEARLFGELLTGAILVRETMAPMHRVQVILSGHGGGQMVADSHPERGLTRGLISRGEGGAPIELGEHAIMRVIRTLPRGELHQSIVAADGASCSAVLMSYMQGSEQVTATLGVATVVDREGWVAASAGYIVQLLPEIQQGPLAVMTERLADFTYLDDGLVGSDSSAEVLLFELLYGMPHERLAESEVFYGCTCSDERAISAVSVLGRGELAQMVGRGEIVEMTCEYCGRRWSVGPERLRAMLADN